MDEDEAVDTNILDLDNTNLLDLSHHHEDKSNSRKFKRKVPMNFFNESNHYCVGNLNSNPYLYFDPKLYSDKSLTVCQKLFKLFTEFPYRASLLLPVFDALSTPKQVARGQDPANFLVEKKLQLQKSIVLSMRKWSKGKLKRSEEVVRDTRNALAMLALEKKTHIIVPRVVARLASCFEEDVDPNFTSDYNWYYNGGNISCVVVDGRKILLSARGENCSILYITPLKHTTSNSKGFRAKESQTAILDRSDDGTIFQITSVKHYGNGLVGIRQRNKCSLYLCKRKPICCLYSVHTSSSEHTPYTSLAINPWGRAQYSVTTAQGGMKIWDIIKNKAKIVFEEDQNTYSSWQWSGVHYSQKSPHILFYTQPKSMQMIDLRDRKNGTEVFKLNSTMSYSCEEISASENSSANDTLQYIASNHQLFSMDIRHPGQYLQSWHHLLKSPPQFIKTCQEAPSMEIVCLGSTEEPNIVSVVNEWPGEDLKVLPMSRSQPYCLGSLETTLEEANLQGLCLKPSVQARLKLNLTGICCLTLPRPAVFCATAAGDVFCQRINRRFAERNVEEEELSMLSSLTLWQEQIKEHELDSELPPLYLSEFLNTSHLKKLVTSKVPENIDPPKSTDLPPLLWQLSRKQLFSDRDVYAPKLLAAWGINDANMWEGERAKAYGEDIYLLPPPVQNIDRVNQWLSTDVLAAVPDSQASHFGSQFDSQDVAPFSQMSEVSQSGRINLTLTHQSEIGYSESQDATTIATNRRQSLPRQSVSGIKRRRTDGF